MKLSTINIRSVKLHHPESILPATDSDGGERASASNMTTNGDTTITDPVLILFFEAPAPEPLNGPCFCRGGA